MIISFLLKYHCQDPAISYFSIAWKIFCDPIIPKQGKMVHFPYSGHQKSLYNSYIVSNQIYIVPTIFLTVLLLIHMNPIEDIEEERHLYEVGNFFGVYILNCRGPDEKGDVYIGFTNNPERRIRQHNREIKGGAWKTKKNKGNWYDFLHCTLTFF